jgi:putative ABC transport system permease protein
MIYELKIILRRIFRNGRISALIIAGLSLAFVIAIPLTCNMSFHWSFDRFHKDAGRIYAVYMDEVYHGTRDRYAELPLVFGEIIRQLFPEAEQMTRTKDESDVLFVLDDDNAWKEDVLWVDHAFKDIFTLELLAGDTASFLSQPNEVFLSESLTKKMFSDQDPLGKTLKINETSYTITGIFKDYPKNSHQKFSALLPLINRIPQEPQYPYESYEFLTYLKLKENTNVQVLEEKLQAVISQKVIPWLKQNYNLDYTFDAENSMKLQLIALTDIHLKDSMISTFEKTNQPSVLYIHITIVLALLLIAFFNLTGFTLSQGKRNQFQSKIKQYLGGSAIRGVNTYILENTCYALIAFALALTFNTLIWHSFPLLKDTASIPFTRYFLPVTYLFIFGILLAIMTGTLQGLYFRRLRSALEKHHMSSSGRWINRSLITFQISASLVLLISILLIYKQMRFVTNYNTGIHAENVLVVNKADRIFGQYAAFKEEILKSPLVKAVACSNSYPFNWMTTASFTTLGTEEKHPYPFQYFRTDIGFREVFGFGLSDGNWFTGQNSSDRNSVILNEAAVRVMGLKNPVGSQISRTEMPSEPLQVIGVIQNFNFRSLHYSVEPLIICPVREGDWWNFIEIKGSTDDNRALTAYVQNIWNKFSGKHYMDYAFLDDLVQIQYQNEFNIRQSVSLFCLIAILISCFGLLGTIMNLATEKTKEIGIRKVNGASMVDIIAMFNRNYLILVILAILIACPVAWFVMHRWLENFAFRTGLSWWIFTAAGGMILVLTATIVSWQSWRAARMNPVEALRYE